MKRRGARRGPQDSTVKRWTPLPSAFLAFWLSPVRKQLPFPSFLLFIRHYSLFTFLITLHRFLVTMKLLTVNIVSISKISHSCSFICIPGKNGRCMGNEWQGEEKKLEEGNTGVWYEVIFNLFVNNKYMHANIPPCIGKYRVTECGYKKSIRCCGLIFLKVIMRVLG